MYYHISIMFFLMTWCSDVSFLTQDGSVVISYICAVTVHRGVNGMSLSYNTCQYIFLSSLFCVVAPCFFFFYWLAFKKKKKRFTIQNKKEIVWRLHRFITCSIDLWTFFFFLQTTLITKEKFLPACHSHRAAGQPGIGVVLPPVILYYCCMTVCLMAAAEHPALPGGP